MTETRSRDSHDQQHPARGGEAEAKSQALALSVVVPVYNSIENLPTLVAKLRAQTCEAGPWELIVVDNGSSDGTWEYLQGLKGEGGVRVRVLREERRGPSAARNCGIRASRGQIVAFIDSDCQPRGDWLEQIAKGFRDPQVWALGGLLLSTPPSSMTELFSARQGILNQEEFFRPMPYKPPFLLTANFAVRRSVFDKIGMFDETLRVGEDADFCWRLLQAGGKLALQRSAVVAHRHRSSFKSFARQMFLYGIGSAEVFARYRDFIGRRYWIDTCTYSRLAKAMLKAVVYPLIKRDPYMRCEGALQVVRYGGFLLGRVVGSLRHRVLVV